MKPPGNQSPDSLLSQPLGDRRRMGLVRLNNRVIYLVCGVGGFLLILFMATLQSPAQGDAPLREPRLKQVEPERWWEGEPDGVQVPAAPPLVIQSHPFATTLSAPITLPIDPRLREATERALDAEIFLSRRSGYRSYSAPPPSRAASSLRPRRPGPPPLPPGLADPRGTHLNGQAAKRAFLADVRNQEPPDYLENSLLDPVARYELKAGTIIPAVLITGANSDLPGQLIAQVRESVRDSLTGNHILIPQGTKIIAVYDSVVTHGQRRLLVAGERLLFPNGQTLNLAGMPLVDLSGYAGMHDQVNQHLFQLFGTATLLSAISGGIQLSQGTFDNDRDNRESAREILAAALGQQLGTVTTEVLRRQIDVQPTLEIRPGYRFNIEVTQDIVLPGPYKGDS